MKFKIIEYNKKYDFQLKKLYLNNITRTATPDGQIYQSQLFEKYGYLKMFICYFIFGLLLYILLQLLINQIMAVIFTVLILLVFFQQGYVIVLVKILIYYYCFNVFIHDFRNIDQYYGSKNNKLWLAIDEEQDDVLGVAALDESTSLLDDLNLWDTVLSDENQKQKHKTQVCELKRMSVSPKAAGKGIGKALTERFIQYAESKGFEYAFLTTYKFNKAATKLYEKLGFQIKQIIPFDSIHNILNLEVSFMVKQFNSTKSK
ncbi:GNAT family acetyltransferase (macronuclear) [Tetrahymena thermophila SB210]|uniref:GNAT family acetyltransferase n=1 Tax=Tetrahymena thermophila (strain SB210) TaxID=312017 RepID=Q240W5_TETTS|nr:GNAT family acetyltransferase [Tetrahymena thermophila SB210]EAS02299.2 GNAT family acetyltransferase [Tetrahymena thermophila SB210]|eukprot:XP_001022544.2 GNAT family acetyltransferase [Tetrahymena thermophila SB210]